VVDFVDVLVKRTPVQRAVHPVVPCIFQHEEDGNLEGHFPERREGDGGRHADVLSHGVEKPNLWELDGEVGDEDEFGAIPLLFRSRDFLLLGNNRQPVQHHFVESRDTVATHILDLVLVQRRYPIDDHPRQTPPEIHHLMHHEAHDASGEHVVAHERIPRRPQPLEVVELDVVL